MDAVTSVTSLPGYLEMTETANSDPNVDMSVFGKLPIYYSATTPTPTNMGYSSISAPEAQERPLNWRPLYIGAATMALLFVFRTAR